MPIPTMKDDRLSLDDIYRFQRENEELRAEIDKLRRSLDARELKVAVLEGSNKELSVELDRARESERWIRHEYEMLGAQMEVVYMIFGGRKDGGGCCGCH